jgi:hypothetical protein
VFLAVPPPNLLEHSSSRLPSLTHGLRPFLPYSLLGTSQTVAARGDRAANVTE